MSIGDESKIAARSYHAVSKETTFGTYASATTAVEVLSNNIRVVRESSKIESINTNRGMVRRVQTMQNVNGTLEMNLHNQESILFLLAAAGPNTLTSSSVTGGMIHSFSSANHETFGSLSLNVRKGDATSGTFRYSGGRVNQLTISGNVGEPIKMSAEMVFKDYTQASDDISSSLSISTLAPWMYHEGQFIYAATEGSLTTSNAEPIQSFELTLNNNVVSDGASRQLGSLVPGVLPTTTRNVEFKITQRYDTTTSFSRAIQGTVGSVRLQFDGASLSASNNNQLQITLPKVYVKAADPEISGVGDILSQEIEFDVLVNDPNTTTGRDIGFTVQNDVSGY